MVPLPKEFSASSQAKVESARLRAAKDLDDYRKGRKERPNRSNGYAGRLRNWTKDEQDLHEFILRVFQAFVCEALRLGETGHWTVSQIRAECDEFLRRLTIDAYYERGFDTSGHRLPEMTEDGTLRSEVRRSFHESDAWREFESDLLKVAERQAEGDGQPSSPGSSSTPFPDLPSPYADQFEAAKAIAELEYATRAQQFLNNPQFADPALHVPVLIHKVFFAFCAEARNACRNGQWSVTQVSKAVNLAWPMICDAYCVREMGAVREEQIAKYRVALWRTVTDANEWRQNQSELAELARTAGHRKLESAAPAAEGSPKNTPLSLAPAGQKGSAKRGPTPDLDSGIRVAEIVARIASDGNWRRKWEEVCEVLDAAEIPVPTTWRKRTPPYTCWADCVEKTLAVKAIEYRLKVVHRLEKAAAETLS